MQGALNCYAGFGAVVTLFVIESLFASCYAQSMLTRTPIDAKDAAQYDTCWQCYETSFPACERRPLVAQMEALKDGRFHVDCYEDEAGFVGLLSYWQFEGLIYAEHFAIAESRRGEGWGSRILKQWLTELVCPVILEIEPMLDDLTHARWRFYEALGFQLLPDAHMQPPYRAGDEPLPLRLLSYPVPLDSQRVARFQCELEEAISAYRMT